MVKLFCHSVHNVDNYRIRKLIYSIKVDSIGKYFSNKGIFNDYSVLVT